jgi:hypothetical protein
MKPGVPGFNRWKRAASRLHSGMLYRLDDIAKRLSTFALTTIARNAECLGRVSKVHGQLFALADPPPAIEKEATLSPLPSQIGIARVVDELGAAAFHAPINHSAFKRTYQKIIVRRLEQGGLIQTQAPAGIFDYFAPRRNVFEGEDP